MSLQIWLPLNGDLHNQGIKDVSITNNGAVINNNGKIGKCYQFGTGTSYLELPSSSMTSFSDCSVTFWIKIISWNTSYCTFFQAGKNAYSWSDYIFGFLRNGSSSRACFTVGDGSTSTSASFLTSNLELNTWYHVTLTYKQAEKCSIYINGKLDHEYNTTRIIAFDKITKIRLGCSNGSGYQTNCLMNDFRIYDNALSQQQIKQIAKGLILHYPLNDVYIEPTENLITTEDGLSSTYYNGAISKYGYGTSTDTYKEVGIFQGKKCTKVYNKTNTTQMQPYVYINNMFTSDGTNKPQYKTLSFDYYTTISTSLVPYKLGSGNGTATYKVRNIEIKTGSGTNQVTIPVKPNMWNHIQITFHGITAANSEWGYIRNLPTHTSNTSNYWLFANMQLEEKDHATGYAGIGGVRENILTYDISGYQNNGTKHNITYETDTPKYEVSSIFKSANTSYIKVSENNWMSQGTEEMTINLWINPNASFSKFFSCTESGGWNTESGSSGYLRFPVHVYTNQAKTSTTYKYDSKQLKISDIPLDEWTMITFVYDETGTRTYINGQLHHTCSFVSYGIHYNTNARLFLGCEASTASPASPYFNGKMSDFRIYATALSAEDILSLYNNEAEIDQSGIIHGQIR